jgi:hypothetical protein
MPESSIILTIQGSTLEEVYQSYLQLGRGLEYAKSLIAATTEPGGAANGHDPEPEPEPAPTRRRRSRDGGVIAAPPEPEPEVELVDTDAMRQKVIDTLRECYFGQGKKLVQALQQEYGVERFSEVPDAKLPALYKQTLAIVEQLAGATAPAADTGPF